MIRKALIGASLALGNLNASSRRLTTVHTSRLVYKVDSEKDDHPFHYAENIHDKIVKNLKYITNLPEIDLSSYICFLRESVKFYNSNCPTYLKHLHSEHSFRRLCSDLCYRIPRIPSKEAVFILVGLCKLRMYDVNPLFVENFWFHHIRMNMKFLSFIDIELLLIHVLERMENSAWLEARKCDLVDRLKMKLLTDEVERLSKPSMISTVNLMHAFNVVDTRITEIIIHSLANQNVPNWPQIHRVLSTLYYQMPKYESLLKEVRRNVLANILDLPFSSLIEILSCIRSKVYHRCFAFYDAQLVDAIVDRAIWDNCDLSTGFTVLNLLSVIGHKHGPLINYLIKKFEDSNVQNTAQMSPIFYYATKVHYTSAANFILKRMLVQRNKLKNTRRKFINITFYMSVLSMYDEDMLKTLFASVNYLDVRESFRLRLLIAIVNIFYPSFTIPSVLQDELDIEKNNTNNSKIDFVDEEMELEEGNEKVLQNVRMFQNKNKKKRIKVFPLKSKLELVFGGPTYVLTNIKVKYRIPVDHAVVFRQGGYPVAINFQNMSNYKKEVLLSDVLIPKNSHVVLFASVPPSGYVLNTGELIATFKTIFNCLKAMKYNIIFVNQMEWEKLSEAEKIPWLMKQIRDNCQEIYKTLD